MNEQNYVVQQIRDQYTEKKTTALDELKALDRKVKKPAIVVALILGVLGFLIMGSGMSLVMTDLGQILGIYEPMVPGIIVGVVGMLLLALTWPVCKGILNRRRRKYADRIIAMSNELMK